MAYSAPELLLVGAAQNLVLGVSPAKDAGGCDPGHEQEDGVSQYDTLGLW